MQKEEKMDFEGWRKKRMINVMKKRAYVILKREKCSAPGSDRTAAILPASGREKLEGREIRGKMREGL